MKVYVGVPNMFENGMFVGQVYKLDLKSNHVEKEQEK
jgi:hypothetical protein